jgi:hypothetical protein
MKSRIASFARSAALAAALALAACGSGDGNNLSELDNELIGNGADPALTSALNDQILTDPGLTQQSNRNAARPAGGPVQAQYPAGSDARVSRASAGDVPGSGPAMPSGACGAPFEYGPEWAGRLPAEFPAYPGGRVTEAAGNNRGDCRVRVVTFVTRDPYNRVLEHYRSLAARAGFTAEHQVRGGDQVLGGVNEASDGAFYLIVTPIRDGSEVALIVNHGR